MVMLEKLEVVLKVCMDGMVMESEIQRVQRILELCVAADLVITNTFFTKSDSQLLSFHSNNACSQINYILVPKSNFKSVRDVTVIDGKECVSQHNLLLGDFELNTSFSKSRFTPPK